MDYHLQDGNIPFFIIIETGRICHIRESTYIKIKNKKTLKKLTVTCMGSMMEYELDVSKVEPLSIQQAELMQALETDRDRLKWFKEKETLQTAQGLTENTEVTVELHGKWLRGIIRYIGNILEKRPLDPIAGTFFGIELQGNDRGKGHTDGTSHSKTRFTCNKDCGVFAPFSRVRPVVPTSLPPRVRTQPQPRPLPIPKSLVDVRTPQSNTDVLIIGDRVTFYPDGRYFGRHGMVMDLEDREGQQFVHISTDTDENGKRGGEVSVPLGWVIKEEVLPAEPEYIDTDAPLEAPKLDRHPLGLDMGYLVEVDMASDKCYGKICWIGILPDRRETMAGLELEKDIGLSDDGTFKGERFFTCPSGRALFVKLLCCRPDSRFPRANHSEGTGTSKEKEKLENVPPISTEDVGRVLIGRMRGIQGHCNSCYMDAALFSLFSCSSVLDSLLFKSTEPRDAPIQDTMLHDIVNPLRSEGFVEGRHIMKLRQQLQEHGYSHSFTTDEKDPEEFLTVIMHHILALEPLLKLSAGGKVQDSYCYQIFLDQSHSLVLPTVQQLLEHSFHGAGLKLAEIPSCLILQMPRFGKKFKMFDKIVPSLQLDITDLLTEGPQQCVLCGQLAREECVDCFREAVFSTTGFKLFCRTCSHQVHTHPQRRAHRPTTLQIPEGLRTEPHVLARDKLELFAVLCIETSHYVSFLKYGPNKQDWIFFDSMADREGESDGFNIPQVQACPEVGVYLDMPPVELANLVPRDMKGVAKRLFCDAYMYLYQSTTMSLYR